MASGQFYISIFVPFFTLLIIYIASTILNRAAINDLRAEMRAGFEALGKRMDSLDARMDRLETRMDRIEARMDRMEGKLDRLTEEVFRLHESRLSRREERVFGRTA